MDKRPLSKRRMALDNFVGRQDILENLDSWTTEFLDGENRFVMIEGMGGIGKSTLLEKWTEDLQKQNLPVVLVRCDDFKGDIFRKAEFISRKLNEFDIKTHRFETIRVMHHRLINNTDPRDIVDEKNPLWAIASYIPGVSSIQEYATTIKEVSRWIKDYLEKRLKNIDKWFKIWFDCDDYNDELIRVVLEDRTLENSLILGALSADIKDSNENVFIIFDVFESVIEDAAIQRIRGEKIILESVDIVEDDLWTLFLGVKEIFGVISGRELPEYTRLPMFDNDSVRSIKLDELDYDSCSKLLVHLRIPTEIHEDIIAASARNPLVISLLCDAAINKPVTAVEIRKLQGKNIDRVREEALAIMMRHLPSPLRLLARIGAITPIFDEPILSQTTAKMPEFGTISVFHNFMQLNMIIPKDVGWSLHDSVRKLLVSDFSQDFLDEWCPRISTVLQNRYDTETNMQFLVAKIEVDSLKNEKEALRNLDDIYNNYLNQIRFGDALDFLSKCYAFFKAHYSLSQINREQSYILSKLRRLDEAENHAKQSIKNALHGLEHSLNLSEDDVENLSQVSEKFSIEFLKDNSDFIYNYVECLKRFGDTLFDSGKFADSEISYKKCLKVLEGLNKIIDVSSERFASIYSELAWICKTELRYKEANDLFSQIIEITRNQVGLDPENNLRLLSTRLNSYSMLLWSVGRYEEAETLLLESLDILQKIVSHESVDDLQSLSHRYRNLADLRRVQGHYEDAEQYYLKSISLRRQLADSYSGYFLSPLCNGERAI